RRVSCTKELAGLKSLGLPRAFALTLAGQQSLALSALPRQLARAPNRLRLLAGLSLGGLLVIVPEFHLPEDTLSLHLLFQRLEGLIDVVVANEHLHAVSTSSLISASGHEQPPP